MLAARGQHQHHIEPISIISAKQTIISVPSEQKEQKPPQGGTIRRPSLRQQSLLRDKIKQDVINHYHENKKNYPTFIRQRRDLIIGKVMAGSTVEEAFAAEARRKR